MSIIWRAGVISLVFWLGACASMPRGLERAALPGKCWVEDSITVEKEWNVARASAPAPAGQLWFAAEPGRVPVLITAPHATEVVRNGKLRPSDGGGTAALVQALHQLVGAHVVYTTYRAPSDPNSALDDEFRDAVEAALATGTVDLVLDIHGSDFLRPYDVDFGTRGRESLGDDQAVLDKLSAALRREGLTNQSLDYFAAKGNTLTGLAVTKGVTAVQLEINAVWLTPSEGGAAAHRYAQLLQGLTRFLADRYDLEALSECPPGH